MKRKRKFGVSVLFLIYLALLVWIILFKLQFNINDLDTVRKINIIPFYANSKYNNYKISNGIFVFQYEYDSKLNGLIYKKFVKE